MKDWRETLIGPTATIHQAIKAIDSSSRQIALVVDGEDRLLGTVTDGDIRRAILRGADMDAPVGNVMKDEPHVARESDSKERLLSRMVSESVRQFPLLDDNGRVTGLVYIDELMTPAEKRDNWVVIMAGGLGTRLRPLTDSAPKPLLPVGDKPLMETILEGFLEHDFRQFYISVNYKAEMIRKHFGDGARWNATIRYLHEDRPLGTAGALCLIKDRP
ncbi:MAG: sugar phosphate nucleotidyltransferase, partial [Rhodospirillales bacterium]|nr:sugar phosphate nucleotidyltransferase [Rhodospirillales bacterium]